jgi:RNA polymerase sigma factor (sigma-70 family)
VENIINADLTVEMEHAASEPLPEWDPISRKDCEIGTQSNLLDVFSAELGLLKRIIAGMGLNASDSEDALQDVSIRALKQQKRNSRSALLSREDSVKWLTKVTVNRCLMEHRSRRTFQRHADEILKRRLETQKTSKPAFEKVIVAEELKIVREGLQELNDALLAPMILRYFCDLDSTEIGEILVLSPSAVRSRLREARMFLAKKLLEKGVEP